jgi:hypothetical protein
VPASLCAGLTITPGEVPVVEVLGAPCALSEVVALRAWRFVPLFGLGPTRDEVVRALANLVRALGAEADPRGAEHALTLLLHPQLGPKPWRALSEAVTDGSAPAVWLELALAYTGLLGASDALREQLAREVGGHPSLALEAALASGAGGGDHGSFREHYAALNTGSESETPAVRVVRAWFDFVLARRFGGLDALQALAEQPALDPASRWLVACGELVAGEERARERMTEIAEGILAPVHALVPRAMSVVARELAELVQHPLALRFHHLRCAAARDHAAMAMRAWLSAASEPEPDESLAEGPVTALGPEPSRAGRAAIEARAAAGEFLLDWFVSDRPAREAVDAFARTALRLYHRLRGAQLLARVECEVRPVGAVRTPMEQLVWATGSQR